MKHINYLKRHAQATTLLLASLFVHLTVWAQNGVSTITTSENIDKSSTVYAGEVVVDGVTKIKYLYSGDMSRNEEVIKNLLNGLQGMSDNSYATLLNGLQADAEVSGITLCSDAGLVAAMDANWKSAQYVGKRYYADNTVTSESSANLYDTDAGFKSALDAQTTARAESIETLADVEKCIVSHIDTRTVTDVWYEIVDGQVVRHSDINVVYDSEATTVIYTKVELESSYDPYTTPLTFEAIEDATTVTISNPQELTIEYSIDGGNTWTETSLASFAIDNLSGGTKVCLRGNNAAYGMPGDVSKATNIQFDKDCYVYGNVMSLISSTDYATLTTLTIPYAFQKLFENNKHFVSHSNKDLVLPATTLTQGCYNMMFTSSTISRAPQLPATTIAPWCYYYMFINCMNLKTAPELPATKMEEECYYGMFYGCIALEEAPDLPAMELDYNCYDNMFRGCTSLIVAPQLPATTLAKGCYEWMFAECTKLETAPTLPATTLAERCYECMFYECSSLVNAPELPATTLADLCYTDMFFSCTSLEKAPVLPAPILVSGCYSYMFAKCSKLNYVECLATDLSANDSPNDWERATHQWLYGVAATGTFVKAEGINDWTIGTSGIPTGWTVEEVSTGIGNLIPDQNSGVGAWYSIDGRRLQGEPTTSGIYVKDGRKVVIKNHQ